VFIQDTIPQTSTFSAISIKTDKDNSMELDTKLAALDDLRKSERLDAILLRRSSSFAWATCGVPSYIYIPSAEGVASILVTSDHRYLIMDKIEAPRLESEYKLREQGWEFIIHNWFEQPNLIHYIEGKKLGADIPMAGAKDLSREISNLRAMLTPEENNRFRELSRLCAQAVEATARSLQPGQIEAEVAAKLSYEAEVRGTQAVVNLIAFDERIFNFRHPLPTTKRLENYAMLVLCGRKWGLVAALTRLIHFGKLPAELKHKMDAVLRIDAHFIAATRPGISMGEVFQAGVQSYAQEGYPEEWYLHHQGGLGGYEGRELIVTPGVRDIVRKGQVYAWNPSITGTKSEDTILIGDNENEVLTAIEGWPTQKIAVAGQEILRPEILEVLD
jgi:Xaa-Pro aminopeptidase